MKSGYNESPGEGRNIQQESSTLLLEVMGTLALDDFMIPGVSHSPGEGQNINASHPRYGWR